jgi:FkbM family methyltransferase
MARLRRAGYRPDTVLDIGASTGAWSVAVNHVFPEARYVLVDPLISRYGRNPALNRLTRLPNFEFVEAAVSDRSGKTRLQVSSDLYDSCLPHVNPAAELAEVVEVEVVTIADLARTHNLRGHCIVKVDVQYAEHLVIDGGQDFIRDYADFVVLELTLDRTHPEARTFDETIALMTQLGFRYFDDAGGWRAPASGILEQKDALFIRRDLLIE